MLLIYKLSLLMWQRSHFFYDTSVNVGHGNNFGEKIAIDIVAIVCNSCEKVKYDIIVHVKFTGF